ncbi:high-affinity lysophosphatidic acid receptor-like, partial [Homarus americanus]|uniref:high-affinity lysophosphatidic acid receptor-like n=1 Tax=Homarus americanus TaxID=6706 RepID=UPI001C4516BF
MVLVGGVGNALVVMLVSGSSAMHSTINILLATLAFCDTLAVVVLLPLDMMSLLGRGWLLPAPLCHAHAALMNVIQVEGMTVLALIFVDRYIIIVHHQDRLTPVITCWVIGVSWVVSVCVATPPLLGVGGYSSLPLPPGLTHCLWEPAIPRPDGQIIYTFVRFSMMGLLPLFVMIFCFVSILGKMRNNSAKVTTSDCEGGLTYIDLMEVARESEKALTPPSSPRRPLVIVNLSYKTRTFTTIMILFLVFVMCRTPLHLMQLVHSFTSTGQVYYDAFPWLLWWAYLQPAVNPVIYTVRIHKFRNELLETFPWLLHLTPGRNGDFLRRSDPSTIYMIQQPSSS